VSWEGGFHQCPFAERSQDLAHDSQSLLIWRDAGGRTRYRCLDCGEVCECGECTGGLLGEGGVS